jgi:CheY-like chemotaxis protein
MAKTTKPNSIILIDDEIHNMSWMIDHLENSGFNVETAINANDAIELLSTEIHRAIIVDLNIPVLEPLVRSITDRGDVYGRYPGLYVAFYARNRGYRDRQVVIYSVHRDPAVTEEAAKLGCTYILKGRPKEIKRELDEVISFDPTDTSI